MKTLKIGDKNAYNSGQGSHGVGSPVARPVAAGLPEISKV